MALEFVKNFLLPDLEKQSYIQDYVESTATFTDHSNHSVISSTNDELNSVDYEASECSCTSSSSSCSSDCSCISQLEMCISHLSVSLTDLTRSLNSDDGVQNHWSIPQEFNSWTDYNEEVPEVVRRYQANYRKKHFGLSSDSMEDEMLLQTVVQQKNPNKEVEELFNKETDKEGLELTTEDLTKTDEEFQKVIETFNSASIVN